MDIYLQYICQWANVCGSVSAAACRQVVEYEGLMFGRKLQY